MQKSDSVVSYIISKYLVAVFSEELINERNGKIENHIVERGESWKSIAGSCGIDEAMLKALNPFEEECLTGLEIRVPRFPNAVVVSGIDERVRMRLQNALDKEKAGNLKEAIKIYSTVIKENPSLDARYLRGRAYYRMKKLKQSTEDFKYVVQNDKDNAFPDAKDIYMQVSEEWERHKEERTQKWINIGLGILDMGMKVANEYVNYKYSTQQTNSFLSGYGYGAVTGGNAMVGSNYSIPGGGAGTDYYHNGVQWPASLDPSRYFTPDVMKVEVTYDAFGNPMYSSPGIANAMMRMQSDFNLDMAKSGNLFSGSAISNALLGQLNMNNYMVSQTAIEMATPTYVVDYQNDGGNDLGNDIGSPGSYNNNSKCIHCEGTGWVKTSQMGVATLGQNLPRKKCKICGYQWDPGLEVHTCVPCRWCKNIQ
ncbi:MAG: hypothetical protein K2K81_08980 [Muribaculaceae bacterium]|nr:hypothetical protein [Muribaculaceae bacterium]